MQRMKTGLGLSFYFLHFYFSMLLLELLILCLVTDKVTQILSVYSLLSFFLSFFVCVCLVIDLWVVMILTESPQHWKTAKFVSPPLSLFYTPLPTMSAHKTALHSSSVVLLFLSCVSCLSLRSQQLYVISSCGDVKSNSDTHVGFLRRKLLNFIILSENSPEQGSQQS